MVTAEALIVGRTLNAVAAKAQRPVLVIKHPPDPRTGLALWRRILVATGGSPWSDVAVDHALDLARTQGLAVCLLCVDSGRVRSFLPSATPGAKNTLALAEVARLPLALPTKHIWPMEYR